MKAPDKICIQPNAHDGWFEGDKPNDNFVEYIRKGTIYGIIGKRFQELWNASSLQADNDGYYKNPLVKQLKELINEIESL